jgi:hypothetical protein
MVCLIDSAAWNGIGASYVYQFPFSIWQCHLQFERVSLFNKLLFFSSFCAHCFSISRAMLTVSHRVSNNNFEMVWKVTIPIQITPPRRHVPASDERKYRAPDPIRWSSSSIIHPTVEGRPWCKQRKYSIGTVKLWQSVTGTTTGHTRT